MQIGLRGLNGEAEKAQAQTALRNAALPSGCVGACPAFSDARRARSGGPGNHMTHRRPPR